MSEALSIQTRILNVKNLVSVNDILEILFNVDHVHPIINCPLKDHSDNTPSFSCYNKRDIGFTKWKCFGCGRGGDIIDLVGFHLMDESGDKADIKGCLDYIEQLFGMDCTRYSPSMTKVILNSISKKRNHNNRTINEPLLLAIEDRLRKKIKKEAKCLSGEDRNNKIVNLIKLYSHIDDLDYMADCSHLFFCKVAKNTSKKLDKMLREIIDG